MALHTKKDFAAICGVELKDLYIYIKRGKVVCTGEYVNDTEEKNILFLSKRESKGKTTTKSVSKSNPLASPPKTGPVESIINYEKPPSSEIKREDLTLIQLEKEKKLADLAKTEAETIYKNLQIEKVRGQTIPTDLVKSLVSILFKSIVSASKDGSDFMLIEVSKRKKLSGNETSELKGIFTKIINEASVKALNEARKNIKIIANDFSDKREVGEHD